MSTAKRVIKLVVPFWPTLAGAVGCMIVIAGATAGLAWLVQPVLDDIFIAATTDPDRAARMLMILPLAFVAMMLIKAAAGYGQEVLMNRIGQGLIAQLRESVYARLQHLSLSYFDRTSTGRLISRLTNEVQLVQDAVSRSAVLAVRDVLTIIGLTGVIFYWDWRLALAAMVVFPLAMIPFARFGRWARRFAIQRQEATADMATHLQETVVGVRVVRAFTAEEREQSRFKVNSDRLLQAIMGSIRVNAATSPVMETLGGLAVAAIMAYGGLRVIAGQSTTGAFMSFMTALVLLYEPVKKLAIAHNHIQQGLSAAERIFKVIDAPVQVTESPRAIDLPPISREIRFEGIDFSYDRHQVLTDFSLTVPRGQIVALAGPSGGGKTTLVSLVPRFHDPDRGRVAIDGHDLKDVSLASLRSQIGLVTQEIILFNDTVRANIAYGRTEVDQAAVEAAAEAAFADEFIAQLPQGYDTVIGERGVTLSGGQRQRLAIARALYKNAPILILDEATSALDTESERYVQKAIDNLMRGRTVLVIAHRLSTIKHADQIIVLQEGRLVEQGNHDELMACQGEYCKLYRMQFAATDGDQPTAADGD